MPESWPSPPSPELPIGSGLAVRELIPHARLLSAHDFADLVGGDVLLGALPGGDPEGRGWSFGTCISSGGENVLPAHDLRSQIAFPLRKANRSFFGRVLLIGRAASNDVQIEHESVSKLHARAWPKGDGVFAFADAGSANGTWIGETRLKRGEKVELHHGKQVRFGACELKLFEIGRLYEFLRLMLPGGELLQEDGD